MKYMIKLQLGLQVHETTITTTAKVSCNICDQVEREMLWKTKKLEIMGIFSISNI